MLQKVLHWFRLAVRQAAPTELYMYALDAATLILFVSNPNRLYPWSIIALCDIIAICAYGAWLNHGGNHADNPITNGAIAPLLVRTFVFIFLIVVEHKPDSAVFANCIWYVAVVASVCYAFYSILLAVHHADNSWLAGTNGRIGIPNWISISRLGLSILIPHIYATSSLGPSSNVIATTTLALAISTDALDGFFARKLHQITKAGKELDPLGDKIIFYPTTVAFLLVTSGTMYLTSWTLRIVLYVSLATMFIRDAGFIVWFFLHYRKLKNGIGASLIDKIRMVFMCIWLGICALALTFPDLRQSLSLAGLVCIVIVATLSVASIVVDYRRARPLLQAAENS